MSIIIEKKGETGEMKNRKSFERAAALFPPDIKEILFALIPSYPGYIREIRVYDGAPLLVHTDGGLRCIADDGSLSSFSGDHCISADVSVMKRVLLNAAGASVYQYEKELSSGYITCFGGIRIGICRDAPAVEKTLDTLTSLNIRLPFEEDYPCPVPDSLYEAGGILIAGAPGSGKTTVLKSFCRRLCDTRRGGMKRVSIVDSRGELSCFAVEGKFYASDIIVCTDKAVGIQRALKLMSPEYIVCDEIGDLRETEAMLEGMNSGVRFITAMHADGIKELTGREQFRRLCLAGAFENAVLLSSESPGIVKQIVKREALENEIYQHCASLRRGTVYGV